MVSEKRELVSEEIVPSPKMPTGRSGAVTQTWERLVNTFVCKGSGMVLRGLIAAGVLAASVIPASAETLGAEEARRFVVGKMFSFTCFEGTKGAGRINADLSVAGTIQFQGSGPTRYVKLPANTLRVEGDRVCATVKGMPFSPCFNLEKTDPRSFRGSLSGLGFAACEFTRRNVGTRMVEDAPQQRRRARPVRSASAAANPAAD